LKLNFHFSLSLEENLKASFIQSIAEVSCHFHQSIINKSGKFDFSIASRVRL
jgi:hypothetical protein